MQSSPNPYPLLIPPAPLSTKGHRDWSSKEADEYKAWLISSLEQRISAVLDYFQITEDGLSGADLLLRLGELATDVLSDSEFSTSEADGTRSLTNAGHAVAADLGLVVARMLIEEGGGKVQWRVMRKPKSDMSYNLPVLSGFGRLTLDPVGGSVAEAHGVLGGRRGSDAWARVLEFWSEKID